MSESRGWVETALRDGNQVDIVLKAVALRARHAAAVLTMTMLVAACATRPPATALDRPASHALAPGVATPLATALAPLEK